MRTSKQYNSLYTTFRYKNTTMTVSKNLSDHWYYIDYWRRGEFICTSSDSIHKCFLKLREKI